MVYLNSFLLKEARSSKKHFRTFIDSLRVLVRGGSGGNGMPKYGGVGGQGGCVYFEAKDHITLKNVYQKHRNKRMFAGNGEDSDKTRILGRRGMDIKVEVPVGVKVLDEESKKVMFELNEEGSSCLAAGGGSGGCSGNNWIGRPGQSRVLKLDLQLIADIGLLGFPNAGKSTLLKKISNASPKIASYPFTTIQPQIGTIDYSDYRQITVADLPGLIEGAHKNIGMGHSFLKHVERTSVLLMIIDIFGFQLSPRHNKRNCLENIFALIKELELDDQSLLEKPCILLVNKMDLNGSIEEYVRYEKIFENLELGLDQCAPEIQPTQLIKFERIIPISAKNNKEIDKVKENVREVIDSVEKKRLFDEEQERNSNELKEKLRERGPKLI